MKLIDVPVVFSTSLPCFIVNHIQMAEEPWKCTKQCLGSAVLSFMLSHAILSAVDPCWAFPMDCYLHHILPRAERAAHSTALEQCIADNFAQLEAYFIPAKFPWCTSSNLLLCAISEQSGRSGKCSQIMWK